MFVSSPRAGLWSKDQSASETTPRGQRRAEPPITVSLISGNKVKDPTPSTSSGQAPSQRTRLEWGTRIGDTSSFVTQRDHGIDFRGASGGEIAGGQSCRRD